MDKRISGSHDQIRDRHFMSLKRKEDEFEMNQRQLREQMLSRTAAKKRRKEIATEWEQLHVLENDLDDQIQRLTSEGEHQRLELAQLNYCSYTSIFANLSDEHLMVVLEYLDLVERERVRRVCKRWSCVLKTTAAVQFINTDTNSGYIQRMRKPQTSADRLMKELMDDSGYVGRQSHNWHYQSSTIRHLSLILHSVLIAVRFQACYHRG